MTQTTINRFNATMTLHNVRRFGVEQVGGQKLWQALHTLGVRDGKETAAIVARCGMPAGGIEKALVKGQVAVEGIIGRTLTEDEAEGYGLGFNAAAY